MVVRVSVLSGLALMLSVSACMTKMAAGTTVNVVAQASPAIARFEDTELAEQGIPASIATMEGLLEIRPHDTQLRELLARAYASFGFGFLEDHMEEALVRDDEGTAERYRNRAGMAFSRARELALGSLSLWQDDAGGAAGHIKLGLSSWVAYLKEFKDPDQAPTLFWATYAWARYIGLNRDDMNSLADLPFVHALADRVLELDPTFMGYAPHALRGGLIGTAPAQLGGRPEEAKTEFELAIRATSGKNLMYHVLLARIVAVALQDRALYKKLLTTVLDAPRDIDPDQRLANQLAKRRAARYLTELEDLFAPEAAPPVAPALAAPPPGAPPPAAPPAVPAPGP